MATSAPAYLLDTNILLRLPDRGIPDFQVVRAALSFLKKSQNRLYYTSQNLIEFWNVATRPVQHNGLGLSIKEADEEAHGIEDALKLLPHNEAIHHEWRRLVVTYGVSGTQVHDAHLVAAMNVYGIDHLLTLNGRDFNRFDWLTVVHPADVVKTKP